MSLIRRGTVSSLADGAVWRIGGAPNSGASDGGCRAVRVVLDQRWCRSGIMGVDVAALSRGSVVVASAIAILFVFTATGCAAESDTKAGVTLAATKSPVQLLRNEAATRIPTSIIETVTQTEDISKACLDEAQDPQGLQRAWHSSAQVVVEDAAHWRIDAVTDEIAATFVEQGWVARPLGGTPTSHVILLSSPNSPAEIQLSANRPDPDASPTSTSTAAGEAVETVTIDLSVHGPCVATEGPESSAVKKLEGRE
jgi:hypothetical protein